MAAEGVIFGVAYLFAAALPLVRVFVGPAPLYVTDLLIACSAFLLLWRRRGLSGVPFLPYVLVLAALLLFSLLSIWAATGDVTYPTYRNGRRLVAMLSFVLAGWLGRAPQSRSLMEKVVVLGLLVHALLVVGQYALSILSPGLLLGLDELYHTNLARVAGVSRVYLWSADWYIPRAYGGYWNPNTAVVALLVPMPFILLVRRSPVAALSAATVALAVLLTGSRQGLITLVAMTAWLVLKSNQLGRMTKTTIIALAAAATVGYIAILPLVNPAVSERLGGRLVDDSLEISVASRLDNYDDFWQYMFIEHPEYLLFGQGVDYTNVLAHSDLGSDFGGGFVSNAWLLIIAQMGLPAFCIFVYLYVRLLLWAGRSQALQASLLAFGLLSFFDNHIATQESLQVIFWTVAGLSAAIPESRLRPTLSTDWSKQHDGVLPRRYVLPSERNWSD